MNTIKRLAARKQETITNPLNYYRRPSSNILTCMKKMLMLLLPICSNRLFHKNRSVWLPSDMCVYVNNETWTKKSLWHIKKKIILTTRYVADAPYFTFWNNRKKRKLPPLTACGLFLAPQPFILELEGCWHLKKCLRRALPTQLKMLWFFFAEKCCENCHHAVFSCCQNYHRHLM